MDNATTQNSSNKKLVLTILSLIALVILAVVIFGDRLNPKRSSPETVTVKNGGLTKDTPNLIINKYGKISFPDPSNISTTSPGVASDLKSYILNNASNVVYKNITFENGRKGILINYNLATTTAVSKVAEQFSQLSSDFDRVLLNSAATDNFGLVDFKNTRIEGRVYLTLLDNSILSIVIETINKK